MRGLPTSGAPQDTDQQAAILAPERQMSNETFPSWAMGLSGALRSTTRKPFGYLRAVRNGESHLPLNGLCLIATYAYFGNLLLTPYSLESLFGRFLMVGGGWPFLLMVILSLSGVALSFLLLTLASPTTDVERSVLRVMGKARLWAPAVLLMLLAAVGHKESFGGPRLQSSVTAYTQQQMENRILRVDIGDTELRLLPDGQIRYSQSSKTTKANWAFQGDGICIDFGTQKECLEVNPVSGLLRAEGQTVGRVRQVEGINQPTNIERLLTE